MLSSTNETREMYIGRGLSELVSLVSLVPLSRVGDYMAYTFEVLSTTAVIIA